MIDLNEIQVGDRLVMVEIKRIKNGCRVESIRKNPDGTIKMVKVRDNTKDGEPGETHWLQAGDASDRLFKEKK